ncbi:energy transducer TonB [Bradyrhizobium sp. LHD-71]|uniref:energy transducer TonB family protein n=1 Tax=Bradyrhizobium sp. LHD-71 TaxID=3072141 RepID=UPI00280C74A9|nr:energy transducer TonB [Bradyrhizobium sp. LHD-71]MDQ8727087.1 energy transducer TonB [Bradyrhizobium sp. LHD-71]
MSALALHHHPDEREFRRYGAAAVAVVLAAAALIAAALFWYERTEPEGVSIPAILVDLAPAPAAQQIQTQDIAPGPEMQEAEAPPPEPPKEEKIEEQLPPTPEQPEPVVAAPPKVEPKPEPEPVKPQPVRKEVKKPTKKPPAPRTTAAPKADRVAPDSPAPASGASAAAAAASYRSILASHLQRYKQYPSGARANNEQGTSALTFTVTRNGRVTSSRLARSSGHASLDQETLALIRRAQPLPAFPSDMREASVTFTVPFSFTMR